MSFLNNYYNPIFVDFHNQAELLKAYEWKKAILGPRADPKDLSDVPGYEAKMAFAVFNTESHRRRAKGKREGVIDTAHRDAWGVDQAYIPRGYNTCRRLMLTDDLAQGISPTPVPVFCDLDQSSSNIIFTDQFMYLHKNTFLLEKDRTKFEDFRVTCNCKGPCQRGKCECVNLHFAMNGDRVKYLGDGRVRCKSPVTDMYTYALVMCGDLCGCPKSCPNRIENALNKNRFEIFRRNQNMGFSLRTMTSISLGEIVMEFVGEIVQGSQIEHDNRRMDYSMEIFSQKGFTALAKKMKKALPRFPKSMFNFKEPDTFIDPYKQGNVSRFISDGCYPNLVPLRVVVNYLHPRDHRMVLYASTHITAGSELFFDYGVDYKKRNKYNCLCGTPMCFHVEGARKWYHIRNHEVRSAMLSLQTSWRRISLEKDANFAQALINREARWRTADFIDLDKDGKETVASMDTLFPYDREPARDEVQLPECEATHAANMRNLTDPIVDLRVQEKLAAEKKMREQAKNRLAMLQGIIDLSSDDEDDKPQRVGERKRAVAIVPPMANRYLVSVDSDDEPSPPSAKRRSGPATKKFNRRSTARKPSSTGTSISSRSSKDSTPSTVDLRAEVGVVCLD